jgi:hypothetical protein
MQAYHGVIVGDLQYTPPIKLRRASAATALRLGGIDE